MIKYNILERLAIINFADKHGNIKSVCKQFNISRTQFYKYKQRFSSEGILGLKNKPASYSIARSKYNQTIIEKILSIAISNPSISSASISQKLKKDKIFLSGMGIYNILKKHNLESKQKRWSILEKKIKSGNIRRLSSNQRLFLSNMNPCFAYYDKVKMPGEQLSQDIVSLYDDTQKYRFYLYILIDTFSNYAFFKLKRSKNKRYLIELLEESAEFLSRFDVSLQTIRTSNLNTFNGKEECVYQQFLAENNLTQHQLNLRPDYDASVQHFLFANHDFIRNQDIADMDEQKWQKYLVNYNENYQYPYYPHYGKSPAQMLQHYAQNKMLWHNISPILNKNPNFIVPPPIHKTHEKDQVENLPLLSLLSTVYTYELFC